jgi:ATP-dependent DNA ligase
MFEKYDGVRGFWNPHHKTFFSRNGKPFQFPSSITQFMPNIMLDGELWYV